MLDEENLSYDDVHEENHLAKVFIKSMEFLASQGKLAKVCPAGSCTGYALYDCGESCETTAEDMKLKEVLENIDNDPSKEEKSYSVCGRNGKETRRCQCCTIQKEMKRFLDQQEAGFDWSFRCLRCRYCLECLKGAGQEMMSMIQEVQQQMICQSVYIDHEKGKAIARLPFLTDPSGKLLDNSKLAERRLESVCKKTLQMLKLKTK